MKKIFLLSRKAFFFSSRDSIRDLGSALYGVSSHVTGLQAFFYLHSISLFWVQVAYYFVIVFSIVSKRYGHDDLQRVSAFFFRLMILFFASFSDFDSH
jgi:hypothetical protein